VIRDKGGEGFGIRFLAAGVGLPRLGDPHARGWRRSLGVTGMAGALFEAMALSRRCVAFR
jgi:hypothetical protein